MEVKICDVCKGTGKVETTGGRGRDTYKDFIGCKKCDKTGRLLVRSFTIELPFNMVEDYIHKSSDRVFHLIQEINSLKTKE